MRVLGDGNQHDTVSLFKTSQNQERKCPHLFKDLGVVSHQFMGFMTVTLVQFFID
jgi:hypothetical protein